MNNLRPPAGLNRILPPASPGQLWRTIVKYIYFINSFTLQNKTDAVMHGLEAVSEEFNRDYRFEVSESPEEAVRAVRRYRDDEAVLTAVGGDGSVNHVLNGLVGTKNILASVPIGTGNDFFRTCMEEYGISGRGAQEPDSFIHEIDLIRVNDRYSINTVCFGIDADIANDDAFIHNRFIPRSMRFNAGVVYHFLTYGKGRFLKVKYDGETVSKRFTTIVAANGRYYGCGYRVSPGSSLGDGQMELYLIDRVHRIRMARLILSMKNAGHLQDPALQMVRTKKLTILSPGPICANIDGEPLRASRFELELLPRGVQLEFNQRFIERALSVIAHAK